MSYNGTVRCSYCYQTGHNRRSCPTLSQRIADEYQGAVNMAEKERARGNETDAQWYDERAEVRRKQYIKRTKIDLATNKKATGKVARAARAERLKNIRCGYCGTKGHTRRTCQNLKNDYAAYMHGTRQLRLEWYNKLKSTGMGVGSLVVGVARGFNDKNEWGSHKVVALVTSIDWQSIDVHNQSNRAIVLQTNNEMTSGGYPLSMANLRLEDVLDFGSDEAKYRDLISLHPSNSIQSFPMGWLDNFSSIKNVFKSSDERPWNYSYSGDLKWLNEARAELNIPKCAYAKSA